MKKMIFVGAIIVAICGTLFANLAKGNDLASLFISGTDDVEVLASGESGPSVSQSYLLKEGEAMTFYNSANRWLTDGCKESIGDICVIRNDGCPQGLSIEAWITIFCTIVTVVACFV